MVGFDKTITVINSTLNTQTGFNTYSKAVIGRVSWFSRIKYVETSKGLAPKRVFRVRIPKNAPSNKEYAPPDALSSPDKQYTLKAGSVLVLGEVAGFLNGDQAIEAILKNHTERFTATGHHDNRRIALQHLYVEGF